MTQVQFTPGQFVRYRATTKLHLGQVSRDLLQDQEVEFDGVTLRLAGGESFTIPSVKGAVLGGWLVPVTDTTTVYQPQPAPVEVHTAQTTGRERQPVRMQAATEEEALVGSVRQTAERRTAAQTGQPAPAATPTAPQAQPVRQAAPPPPPVRDPNDVDGANNYNQQMLAQALAQPVVKPATFGGQRHDSVDENQPVGAGKKFSLLKMDESQGVAVGQVRAAPLGATVGREGDASKNVKPANLGSISGEAVLGSLQPQTGIVVNPPARPAASGAQVIEEELPHTLPAVRVAHSQTQIPADGNESINETFDGGYTGDVATTLSGDDLADLLPGAAVAGYRPVSDEPPATPPVQARPRVTREQAIQEVVSSWDMSRHWKHRVKEALDFYGNEPDILSAICGVETKGVVSEIQKHLDGA